MIIRSRFGNRVLGFLGVVYFVSAFVTLLYYVVTNWGANRLTDLVLQAALVGAAAAGVFFVLIAADNLKLFGGHPLSGSRSQRAPATTRA